MSAPLPEYPPLPATLDEALATWVRGSALALVETCVWCNEAILPHHGYARHAGPIHNGRGDAETGPRCLEEFDRFTYTPDEAEAGEP